MIDFDFNILLKYNKQNLVHPNLLLKLGVTIKKYKFYCTRTYQSDLKLKYVNKCADK